MDRIGERLNHLITCLLLGVGLFVCHGVIASTPLLHAVCRCLCAHTAGERDNMMKGRRGGLHCVHAAGERERIR
jgi:hypothetical protein